MLFGFGIPIAVLAYLFIMRKRKNQGFKEIQSVWTARRWLISAVAILYFLLTVIDMLLMLETLRKSSQNNLAEFIPSLLFNGFAMGVVLVCIAQPGPQMAFKLLKETQNRAEYSKVTPI